MDEWKRKGWGMEYERVKEQFTGYDRGVVEWGGEVMRRR